MTIISVTHVPMLLSFALWVLLLIFVNEGQSKDGRTNVMCHEFTITLALESRQQERLSLSCGVFEIKGPRKAYPDLHEYLSDQRPVYRCLDMIDSTEFRLFHRGACWRVERLFEDGATEEVACLKSWAASPLTLLTATPKLNNTVTVKQCRQDQNLSTFHLTDIGRVHKAYTSFYVKFARDPQAGQDFFYGVSSRYFAWFQQGAWFFSAHWKNVGGADYARMQCAGDAK